MARECLRREAGRIGPVIVSKDAAPVKEIIRTGDRVDLYELPLLKHHEMDGGALCRYVERRQRSCQRCL
jgi:UbiD family decarboxylase